MTSLYITKRDPDRAVVTARSTADVAYVLGNCASVGNCRDGGRPDPGGPAPGAEPTHNPQPGDRYEQNDGREQQVHVLFGTVHDPKIWPTLLLGPLPRPRLEGKAPASRNQALRPVQPTDREVQCQVLLSQVPLHTFGQADQGMRRVRPPAEWQTRRGAVLFAKVQGETLGPRTFLHPYLTPRFIGIGKLQDFAVGTPGNRSRSVWKPMSGRSEPSPVFRRNGPRKIDVGMNPIHSFAPG